ncbi:methionine--tRNA ligase, partial [Candidatus Woesearchaeota archaeon]|nr:methionine--tRNA ligase [Candidatus Woesearchaeota archaeon]
MAKKFYITTAIDYVNARPHIGHAFEKVLADTIARWHRLLGEDVFFLTGVDENAQKNVEAAIKAGIPTREFVDKNAKFFLELCRKLNISYSDFIRTTAKEHEVVVYKLFKKIIANGDIYKGEYSGLYCVGCETYYTEKDLVDGKCPEHEKEPEYRKEEAYFFRLSKYRKELLKFIPNYVIPESKRNEALVRINEELIDICISRKNAKWGIDFPNDKDYKIWVWIEALINYVSGLKNKEKKYWPAQLHVIGKGINWFHSVIWPALLLSAKYPLPKKLLVHGYLILGGKKISKTLGNVVDPLELLEKYSVDSVRFSLLRCSVFEDSDFSEGNLVERHNNELANDLGNLVSRTLTLAEVNFNSNIKKSKLDKELTSKLNIKKIQEYMDKYELNNALNEIWKFVRDCNKHINEEKPWEMEKKEMENHLYTIIDSLRIISILLSPFIPKTSEEISKQLGVKLSNSIKDCKFGIIKNYKINKGDILFKKIEVKKEVKEIKPDIKE